jgi:tetratricopeptide (TPR) repeat protein
MIYDHKDKDTLQKYGVRAFPTFVVTDAEGTELMRKVGAGGLATPKEATEWFTNVADALDNLPKYEEAHKKNPEDVDVALKLANAYNSLGKSTEALELYEGLAKKLDKKDARRVDVHLKLGEALTGTIDRDNQAEVGKRVQEIYDEILPGLIKSKDERAVEPGIMNTKIKSMLNKDHKAARKDAQALLMAFAKHDRVKEIKFFAAYYAKQDGDNDTARKELDVLIKEGPEDDRWVKSAKKVIEQMDKADEPKESGDEG